MYLFPIFVENLFHFAYQLNFSPICSLIWNVVSGLTVPFVPLSLSCLQQSFNGLFEHIRCVCLHLLRVCVSIRVLAHAYSLFSFRIIDAVLFSVDRCSLERLLVDLFPLCTFCSCALFFTHTHGIIVIRLCLRFTPKQCETERRSRTRVSEYFAIYPFSNEFVYNITNEQMPTEWDFFRSQCVRVCVQFHAALEI